MSNAQFNIPEKSSLLALMMFVVEASNVELRERYGFTISGDVRKKLEQHGLVESRRLHGVPGRPYALQLTEKGWRWCREELSAQPPKGAVRGYRLLYGMLNVIDGHMRRSQLAMEHVFAADGEPDIEQRIHAAYKGLVAEPGGWVGLRRLRERLADIPRNDLDAALLRIDSEPGVFLEPEINQKALSDADWAAAIRIGGEEKHLLLIERA